MDIGAHPLLARPLILAVAIGLAVAYGSLIPFDFAWSQQVKDAGGVWSAILQTLASPDWVQAVPGKSTLGVSYALSDLLMNLVLYVPLGAALRMAWRLRVRRWPIELVGTVAIAFTLSWSVESLQGLMPARVASCNDVVANTASALVAALVAPYLWGTYKRVTFWCYCRLAALIDRCRALRERPAVAIAIALCNAVLIGLWYLAEFEHAGDSGAGGLSLPFEQAFYLPYDLGAVLLGKALLVYAGLGCLLLLLTYTGRRRYAMGWVVLGVVLLALGAELSRAATHNAMPDITGPLLALTAGVMMTVTVYYFSLAVKRSNRRHRELRYEGPERRRRPHEYS